MNIEEIIEKVTEYVHRQLDYSQYDSTIIRDNTNCYAHAIGSTYSYRQIYRIGAISKSKSIDEDYFSEDEIKTLFLKDMETLKLDIEEIEVKSKEECLSKIGEIKIEENQYVVFLFADYFGNGKLSDFHFWRYDAKGLSEKRFTQKPIFIDEPKNTWKYGMNLVGLFRITK
jgi:hypothetical protein